MNRIYLVDDDNSVTSVLKLIIENNKCGEICGFAHNGEDALEDLASSRPDIVIVDLLMPKMDGITFIRRARERFPEICYIMLSQVSSKDMVAKAYESGVQFFIQKPINSVEVLNVVNNVNSFLQMRKTYNQMQTIFHRNGQQQELPSWAKNEDSSIDPCNAKANAILQKLGIGGDQGSKDIIQIVCHINQKGNEPFQQNINTLCQELSDSPKAMEQRVRRAVYAGMVNLANMGLEDYQNQTFLDYGGVLYKFEQVRKEMDCIRGRSDTHGKVSLRNFLYTLADLCR